MRIEKTGVGSLEVRLKRPSRPPIETPERPGEEGDHPHDHEEEAPDFNQAANDGANM